MDKILFCQSCSMPLEKEEMFGTNRDGSKNKEYCVYCYEQGAFTDPDITLEQMLNKVEHIMKQMDIAQDLIDQAKEMIPHLKRWKK